MREIYAKLAHNLLCPEKMSIPIPFGAMNYPAASCGVVNPVVNKIWLSVKPILPHPENYSSKGKGPFETIARNNDPGTLPIRPAFFCRMLAFFMASHKRHQRTGGKSSYRKTPRICQSTHHPAGTTPKGLAISLPFW
jgi:hypothetical protein